MKSCYNHHYMVGWRAKISNFHVHPPFGGERRNNYFYHHQMVGWRAKIINESYGPTSGWA